MKWCGLASNFGSVMSSDCCREVSVNCEQPGRPGQEHNSLVHRRGIMSQLETNFDASSGNLP